jgi:hypothetical protein
MVHGLVVPDPRTGRGVEADHALREEIVTQPVAA